MNVGKHSVPRPIAVRSRPPSKNPTIGYCPAPAPDLATKSGSSAGITLPFVAAQALSLGSQTPFAPAVLLMSCVKVTLPSLFTLATTKTWMLEVPPPFTKLLRIRTSPTLWWAGLPRAS